jgi:hypothetical protein
VRYLKRLILKWKLRVMSPEQLERFIEERQLLLRQLERLQYIAQNSEMIGDMIDRQGIDPEDVEGVDRYLRSVGI